MNTSNKSTVSGRADAGTLIMYESPWCYSCATGRHNSDKQWVVTTSLTPVLSQPQHPICTRQQSNTQYRRTSCKIILREPWQTLPAMLHQHPSSASTSHPHSQEHCLLMSCSHPIKSHPANTVQDKQTVCMVYVYINMTASAFHRQATLLNAQLLHSFNALHICAMAPVRCTCKPL